MTHFRTSTTPPEIDAPHLCATELIGRPGTLPTLAFPMTRTIRPDADAIWRYLREPADFFGICMPAVDEVDSAISEFAATVWRGHGPSLIAAEVTIAADRGASRVLASGAPVRPVRADAVRLMGADSVTAPHRAADPWWRRMAARTTSRGDLDQLARWLGARGFADGVTNTGEPLLGALVLETDGDCVGVENPEPASILDQLEHCGAIAAIGRSRAHPALTGGAWWISPRYEIHPIAEIDGTPVTTAAEAVPPFARLS